jgi:hypothetical protein
MLGEVHDRLQGGVHEPFVEFRDRAQIIENLRQERPVVGAGHSAVAAGVAPNRLGGLVEADPPVTRFFEAVARLGGVEAVLDGGENLEPQLPRKNDSLRPAVATAGDGFGADAVAFELRGDL